MSRPGFCLEKASLSSVGGWVASSKSEARSPVWRIVQVGAPTPERTVKWSKEDRSLTWEVMKGESWVLDGNI